MDSPGELVQRRGRGRLAPPSSSSSSSLSSAAAVPQYPDDGASSVGSPRSASPPDDDVVDALAVLRHQNRPSAALSKGKSLKERSQIPPSFAVTFGTILGLQCCSGMWQTSTLDSWYASLRDSAVQLGKLTSNAIHVMFGAKRATTTTAEYPSSVLLVATGSWIQYTKTVFVTVFCAFLFYVFFVAPALAGMWTGHKARRAVFHRYMGLSYLIHYVLACVELITNYGAAKNSYLCHIVTVTGILQGTSAFFTFKVLPELSDPGYYSDRAVLSRNFIHENIFFTIMSVFGSVYYNETARANLRTNLPGRIMELLYVFWPYIVIRPWYPITRFSDAGSTYKGRTEQNQRFYELATRTVKIFYLWAKYFLCFFMNFMIYLNLVDDRHWHFMHAMLLLNAGTVSLSVFLHTLRFKKVLPAKFTFTLYLGQIYLSFTAVPIALEMFMTHPKLCGLCLVGLLLNMTRSRRLHAVWCAAAMGLLTLTKIEW